MLPNPDLPRASSEKELLAEKKKYQSDFDSLVSMSVAIFSPSEKVIKHIVVLNAGPGARIQTPGLEDVKTTAKLQGISLSLGNSIVDQASLQWYGIDISAIANAHKYQRAMESSQYCNLGDYGWYDNCYPTFPIPSEQSLHYSASILISGKNTVFNVSNETDGLLHLAAHTNNPIGSSIQWFAWNDAGEKKAEYTQKFTSIVSPNDTGIVKIIAADQKGIDEIYSADVIGAMFGVVRYDYALVALESDSIGSVASLAQQKGGLPYLSSSEIYQPEPDTGGSSAIKKKIEELRSLLFIRGRLDGKVQFEVQGKLAAMIRQAEILDMNGKRITSLDARTLAHEGQVLWNSSRSSKGIYLIRISAGNLSFCKSFIVQ
jgi:hypothetical protein